jgi:putative oxidoreductase
MKNLIINYRPLNTDVASLFLRMILGGLFVRYGYNKFMDYDKMLSMFTDIIGIGTKLSLDLLIFAEGFCGLLVLIGCFTRLSVIPIFIAMFVAYFIAHANDPFDVKTLPLVYMLLSIVIFVLGSGKHSIDGLLFKKHHNKKFVEV